MTLDQIKQLGAIQALREHIRELTGNVIRHAVALHKCTEPEGSVTVTVKALTCYFREMEETNDEIKTLKNEYSEKYHAGNGAGLTNDGMLDHSNRLRHYAFKGKDRDVSGHGFRRKRETGIEIGVSARGGQPQAD